MLDRSRFAEIAETRPAFSLPGTGFRIPVQLGKDDDGDFQLFGERLDAVGNFGNFDLAVLLGTSGGGSQELEVIDDDEFDPLTFLEASGLGAEGEDMENMENLASPEGSADKEKLGKILKGIMGACKRNGVFVVSTDENATIKVDGKLFIIGIKGEEDEDFTSAYRPQ